MAGYNSSVKRHRQSETRRLQNKSVRSEVRTCIKKFHQAVGANNKADAEKQYLETQILIDGAVTKGVFHKNTASRTKSRLAHALSKLGAS